MPETDHFRARQLGYLGFLMRTARAEAVPFKENVVKFIMECRVTDGGIPFFRTRYAQKPFTSGEVRYVQGICYMGKDNVTSQWFSDVPSDDFEHMHLNNDDFLYVLRKYGSPKDLESALDAPVVVV